MTDDQIMAAGPWFQQVTFPGGLVVGQWWTEQMYATLCAGIDMRQKTVIDIGCNAGVGTKWLETQGATVRPCDVSDLYRRQFALVKQAFSLSAEYESLSVYDVAADDPADVVIMAGVYYHLEHPLLGLSKAWAATREVLCVEGEVMPGADAVALFVPDAYRGDGSNWWVPTKTCLEAWLNWLPGDKLIRDVQPFGGLANRALYQVWRGR